MPPSGAVLNFLLRYSSDALPLPMGFGLRYLGLLLFEIFRVRFLGAVCVNNIFSMFFLQRQLTTF